jgi:hypothetical protein
MESYSRAIAFAVLVPLGWISWQENQGLFFNNDMDSAVVAE